MSYIGFDEKYVRPICVEDKDSTLRHKDREDLPEVGEVVDAVVSHDEGSFARLRVTDVYEMTVEEIVNTNFDGHQNYDSVEEFNECMNQYYTVEFTASDTVYMVEFELVEVLIDDFQP